MEGYFLAAGFMVWLAIIGWGLYKAVEEKPVYLWVSVVTTGLGIGFIMQTAIEERRQGPCVLYEKRMHFNPATKTMTPMRVCLERGEWADD